MKYIIIGCSICFLFSCNLFEKDYYEKVTQIKFPGKYKIIATADNGEYLTITILSLDKSVCRKFISENNFKPIDKKHPITLTGLYLLDSSLKKIPNQDIILERHVDKEYGKTGWTYLVDTITGRLYCEIQYPDFAGN